MSDGTKYVVARYGKHFEVQGPDGRLCVVYGERGREVLANAQERAEGIAATLNLHDEMAEALRACVGRLQVTTAILEVEARSHRESGRVGHAEPLEGQARDNRAAISEWSALLARLDSED